MTPDEVVKAAKINAGLNKLLGNYFDLTKRKEVVIECSMIPSLGTYGLNHAILGVSLSKNGVLRLMEDEIALQKQQLRDMGVDI